MAFIPKDAEWYVAEVVSRIRVGDDPRIVSHVDVHLVHATSPDQAYDKANAIGHDKVATYENPAGESVVIEFLGLRQLLVMHDELEDGCELFFEEHVGAIPPVRVRKKKELAVFESVPPPGDKPDYSDAAIMSEVADMLDES